MPGLACLSPGPVHLKKALKAIKGTPSPSAQDTQGGLVCWHTPLTSHPSTSVALTVLMAARMALSEASAMTKAQQCEGQGRGDRRFLSQMATHTPSRTTPSPPRLSLRLALAVTTLCLLFRLHNDADAPDTTVFSSSHSEATASTCPYSCPTIRDRHSITAMSYSHLWNHGGTAVETTLRGSRRRGRPLELPFTWISLLDSFPSVLPRLVHLAEATINVNAHKGDLAGKVNVFANKTMKLCFLWSGLITDKGHTEAHDHSRILLLDAMRAQYGANTTHNVTFVDYVLQNAAESTDYPAQLKSVMDQRCNYFYAAYYNFAPPELLKMYAAQYPNMLIVVSGAGGWSADQPRNMIVAEPLCDREWYLAGFVAGKVARLSAASNPKVGMVIPFLDQQTYVAHAFALGIQAAEPDVILTAVAAGSWGDADLDEGVTLTLLNDKRVDVIASTMNLPTANSEARRLNKFSVGWHYDRRSQFGDTVLVSVLRTFDEEFYSTLEDWMFNVSRASFQRFHCELSDIGPGAGSATIAAFKVVNATVNATKDVWGSPLYFQNGSFASPALLDDAKTVLQIPFVTNTSVTGPVFQYTTSCGDGFYGVRILTPAVDMQCVRCPAGTFSKAGSTFCHKCPSGETSSEGAASCSSDFWDLGNILIVTLSGFVFICLIIILAVAIHCCVRRRKKAATKETEEQTRMDWVMAAMAKMSINGSSPHMASSGNLNQDSSSGSGNQTAFVSIPTVALEGASSSNPSFLINRTPMSRRGGRAGSSDDEECSTIDSGLPFGRRRNNRGDGQFYLPSMQLAGVGAMQMADSNGRSTRSSSGMPLSIEKEAPNSLVQPPFEMLSGSSGVGNAVVRSFESERLERRNLIMERHYYVGQPIVVSVGGPQLYKVILSNGTIISLREEYGVNGSAKMEMERLTRLPSHPNVLDHYCVTYAPETGATCFFQELFGTGQTLRSTVEEVNRPLSEFTARAFVKQLLSGLSHLHNFHIAHRNLQLKNILVSNSGRIKIAEFSSARGVEEGCDQSLTVVAAPESTPPEMITGRLVLSDEYEQATKGDVWNLGVLTSELLNRGHGPWPTSCSKVQEIVRFLTSSEDPVLPDGISESARSFLSVCLNRDPAKRWSASQLETHPWITGADKVDSMSSVRGSQSTIGSNNNHNHNTSASDSSPSTQTILNRFALVRDIGHGAFGTVYEATLLATGQSIAVKVIAYDSRHASGTMRFKKVMKEIDVMERLNHPNIVQFYFLEKGPLAQHGSQTIYIAMEFVEGGTLRQLMRSSGDILLATRSEGSTPPPAPRGCEDTHTHEPAHERSTPLVPSAVVVGASLRALGEPEAAYFVSQMLLGLVYLHERGFIHRDIKPVNCLLKAGTGSLSDTCAMSHLRALATPFVPAGTDVASLPLPELVAAASCSEAVRNTLTSKNVLATSLSPEEDAAFGCRGEIRESNSSDSPGETPSISIANDREVADPTPTATSTARQVGGGKPRTLPYYECLTLKLADFGTAAAVQNGGGVMETLSTNMQGTLLYMAPEIIREELPSVKADIWSLGASTLELVTGEHPWLHALGNISTFALVSLVTSEEPVTLPSHVPMSDDLKDFLALCLEKNVDKRPTAAELLHHKWIHGALPKSLED